MSEAKDDARHLTIQRIPVDQIQASSQQARKYFDEDAIRGLAESMKQEGLLQAVTVRRIGEPAKGRMGEEANERMREGANGGAGETSDSSPTRPFAGTPIRTYELIAGERRLRAAKLLGWQEIDACVLDVESDSEAAAKGLIENLQREDLNPIEEAEGIKAILDLKDNTWTQKQVGEVCGKPQSRISESLRLLELPDTIKENIRRRIFSRDHGVELLRINNPKSQKRMALKLVQNGWSAKELRAKIDAKLSGKKAVSAAKEPDPLAFLWQQIQISGNPDLAGSAWEAHYRGNSRWTFEITGSIPMPEVGLAKALLALGTFVLNSGGDAPEAVQRGRYTGGETPGTPAVSSPPDRPRPTDSEVSPPPHRLRPNDPAVSAALKKAEAAQEEATHKMIEESFPGGMAELRKQMAAAEANSSSAKENEEVERRLAKFLKESKEREL